MSRPIYEPSLPRADAELGYGNRQLFRRPAPISETATGTSVVYLDTWNYDSRNTVDSELWTPVANFDGAGATGPDGYFEETIYSPDTGGMTWDYKSGQITMNDDYAYVIHAWVQWEEVPQIDNELRVVSLTLDPGIDRHITPYRFDIADGAIAQEFLPATTQRVMGFGTATVQLDVWHNAGVDLSIRDAQLMVRRFEPMSEPPATFEANDPFA